MQQRDERAAAGEPDGRLAGGVAAADDGDARAGAELGFGRPCCVEDGQSLELGKAVDRKPPVLRAGREQDRARRDLLVVLEADDAGRSPVRGTARGTASRCAR